MLGPRHLPTYLDVVNFESDLEKHHRKLANIQNGQRKKIFDKDITSNKTAGGRDKVLRFHNSEKALAIEKDNELLLGRLVEISRKRQNPLFPLNEPKIQTKSLNANSRKKEKDRIAAENEAFARRLLSQQPSFNRRKLDDDFDRHSERVRLMQKFVGYNNRIKLPPIQYQKYEDIDDTRKSQSGKEKRTIKELGKKKRRKSHKIDEREEIAEEEEDRRREDETKLKEETERQEKEAQEQKELEEKLKQEEQERKEKELQEQREKEQREKEEVEIKVREAKEEQERVEKLKKEEEERLRLEAEKKKLEEENAKKSQGIPPAGLAGLARGTTIKK